MIVSFALLGAFGAASGAPLADIFVDASANCATGAGTAAAPFCTINEAVGAAVSGDVIRIAAGTYTENLSLGTNIELVGTDGQALTTIDGGLTGTVVTVQTGSTVAIDGLTIRNGSASGIVNSGTLALRNSTVTDNAAGGAFYPGGIRQYYGGPLTIENCTITNNTTNGVYAYGSSPTTITDSTISGNSAFSGAGVLANGSDVTLSGTTVTGNTNLSYGIVYSVAGGSLVVENSTISGNSGGGIDLGTGSLVLRNSTIFGNDGLSSGAGIYAFASGVPELINTVVAGTTNSYSGTELQGTFLSNGSNFIASFDSYYATGFADGVNNDQVGSFASPLDPLLGPLADNGGPTLTHQPLTGSPLISAGDQVTFLPLDQRGVARASGSVDIGSTEDTDAGLGTNVCTGNVNSTGMAGVLFASGSIVAADNDLTFTASSLPPGNLGLLVNSRNALPAPFFPVGDGLLCVGPGFGRHTSIAAMSDMAGTISNTVDLTALPRSSTPTEPALAGQTWYFQLWHRDSGGTNGSNLTNALEFVFQ